MPDLEMPAPSNTSQPHPVGVNIWSGADTVLGAALTNPTELSREKGKVLKRYSVLFKGTRYRDAEQAYKVLRLESTHERDRLMAELIAAKFTQHPELLAEVTALGGVEFLSVCSHWTNANSESSQRWEGAGLESRFIRNLVSGYVLADQGDLTEDCQRALF
jgi:hypothetical protein